MCFIWRSWILQFLGRWTHLRFVGESSTGVPTVRPWHLHLLSFCRWWGWWHTGGCRHGRRGLVPQVEYAPNWSHFSSATPIHFFFCILVLKRYLEMWEEGHFLDVIMARKCYWNLVDWGQRWQTFLKYTEESHIERLVLSKMPLVPPLRNTIWMSALDTQLPKRKTWKSSKIPSSLFPSPHPANLSLSPVNYTS